jgi:ribosomal protein S18 acetylase RimI-like enzyme
MPIMNITYRYATHDDLDSICKFVDFWLSGKAAEEGITGGGTDYFIARGRHRDYLKNYKVVLAANDDELLGWGVMQRDGTLIHLLISGDYRGFGIGSKLMQLLQPAAVRSKTDQSTGNPNAFYEHLGFTEHAHSQIGKHMNIDVLKKPTQQI